MSTSTEEFPAPARSRAVPYGLGAACGVAATVVRFALNPIFSERVPFLLYFPAVLIAAYNGGLGPGLAATAVSVVCADYFFMEPTHSFLIADPRDVLRLAMFAGVCGGISYVCGRLRTARLAAEASARDAETAKRLGLDLLAREKAAREEAERASRLKDEFLATVSHELRTPLNPIVGWARILRKRIADPSATHGLDVIERNTVALNQLIEDLLDVSRIVAGKMRLDVAPVDLAAVVDAAVESVRLAAEAKGIRLETEVDARAGGVLGDAARLQQVVWNLLSNAVRYTPEGGAVRVSARRDGATAELTVTDTGVGIEPEFLPHVFERFRQADSSTRRQHGGLGLGLAIVRHLAELHGGTVSAASEGEGKGATFTVRLPAGADGGRPAEAERADGASAAESLAGRRIVVVEDDRDTRELLALVLEQRGAEVEAVSNAVDAVAAVRSRRPDAVISDIGMPDRDGYDLVAELRAEPGAGRLPVVALTAYSRGKDRARALEAGFDAHLAKPVDPDALVAAVAALLAS